MTTSPRIRTGKNEYELGSFLKERRIENGWTREEAAAKLEVSTRQLQSIENQPPSSFLVLQKILDFYGYKLIPKRLHTSEDETSSSMRELQSLIKAEFSGDTASSKKSQLVLAGRIIEIVKKLSKDL